MGNVQAAFPAEEQLRMVSFTVDPDKDNPEVLKKYAEIRNAKEEDCLSVHK